MSYKQKKLKNGLQIILAPIKATEAVAVLVLFKVGSRYESKELAGIAHFTEHMMFKGAKKWSAFLEISQALDSVGAESNAYTSKEYTGYQVKTDCKHIDFTLDILSDIILHSKFEDEEIQRESGAIVEEINMYKDTPLYSIEDDMEELIYGNNHPLGRNIIGNIKTVNSVNHAKMVDYFNKYYQANNVVIVAAGNLKADYNKKIEKYFNFSNKRGIKKFDTFKDTQNKARVSIQFKRTEQAHLALGFPSYNYDHKKINALYLLNIILGGNMSSRLFVNIRERQGLCYVIRSKVNEFQDTGNIFIHAGLDKKRIKKAVKLILKELARIKDEPIIAQELKRAKDYIRGKMILELEDSASVAEWYARQAMFRSKILTLEQKMKEIDKVTARDIQNVANDIFKKEKANLAIIGPFVKTKEKEFLKLIDF